MFKKYFTKALGALLIFLTLTLSSVNATEFRVVSYNILANAYTYPEYYPDVQPEFLQWNVRREVLYDKILSLDADILCLQEIEPEVFADLNTVLRQMGYDGVYAKKGKGRPDGCATFFRWEKFDFAGAGAIYYDDNYQGSFSGHVALRLYLRTKTGETFGIVNTHVRWGDPDQPPEQHVGYREVTELLDCYMVNPLVDHWMLVGDFNALPESAVVKTVLDHGFLDAYADLPQPTTLARVVGRLDYIFHSRGLTVIPEPLEEINQNTILPNAVEPSDHLPISTTVILGDNY